MIFSGPKTKGKKVYVCNGSACLCAGTQDQLIEDLKGTFKDEEIGHMTCLGRCHENAAFHFKGRNYSALGEGQLEAALAEGEELNADSYEVRSMGENVLTAEFEGMGVYAELLQAALAKKSADVLEGVKAAGIRGRGGAGFPMGVKWEFARNAESDLKFIICNADEGDPGSVFRSVPSRTKAAFGAVWDDYCRVLHEGRVGVLYIRTEYPESFNIVEAAIDDFRDAGLLGRDIDGSGFNFDFKIVQGQGSYICGEETALISSIEGQRPEVRVRPPFPAQKGLFNKPTIVNNVETLATVPYIIAKGVPLMQPWEPRSLMAQNSSV